MIFLYINVSYNVIFQLPSRFNSNNERLLFKDSLNWLAPLSPISFPVHHHSSKILYYNSSFHQKLRPKFNTNNVELILNASLILVAPSSPILFSAYKFYSAKTHYITLNFAIITTQIQLKQCSINLQRFT